VLHPRSTGLLFILRTLTPQIPTLRLLDITIGYPGVTRGGYAQEWYGLTSVFIKGIPPPTIHIHLRMVDLRTEEIPGVTARAPDTRKVENGKATDTTPLLVDQPTAGPAHPTSIPGLATEKEAKAFNIWLRKRWGDKEVLLDRFTRTGGFAVRDGEVDEVERRGLVSGEAVVVPIALW
jgi:lysocardiolipin and lysophospholipid acyltransferase